MKKTRLLEIIREEITIALSETTNVILTNRKGESDTLPYNSSSEKAEVNKLKQDSNITSIKTTAGQKIKELADKYQIDEETLNEMASIKQLKTQLEKQGKDKELQAIKDTEKTVLDTLKKDPNITSDGRLKGYVSAFKKELKASHDIGLQDLLTTVMLDAEEAGDKFKDDISTNTIEKDAANQITGKEAGQRGRKPSEKKAEEPKAKKEKAEKPAKEKPESKAKDEEEDAEEIDDSTYYKSEEEFGSTEKEPSAKDVKAAEKEFGNVSSDKLEKFNTGLKFIKKYKDDKKVIDAYLKKAKDEYKLPANMIKDLKRAAGRNVEA
jgi:hypothetical protein